MKFSKYHCCIATLTALLLAPAAIAQNLAPGNKRASSFTPWTFQTDFRNGIPGWLSYPLAQDEGFDPSLYTTHEGAPALVRDVVAQGQKILRVGLLRPLRFRATPSLILELSYALDMGGRVSRARIILAATNGQRYIHSIPTGRGTHQVQISGSQFGLPAAGVIIEAIVVETEVGSPILGSRNHLTLRILKVEAERPPSLSLEAPQIASSRVSGVSVARQVVTTQAHLEVRLGPGPAGRADFDNGLGKLAVEKRIPEKSAGDWQVNFAPAATEFSPGLWSAEIRRGAAQKDFRFLVLGKMPPHPRILLTAGRLAQLRSQTKLVDIVRQQAAQLRASLAYNPGAGGNIALLSPASVFPGLVQYFQLMEDYSRAIAFNALDFRLSRNRQALESARKALETISDWPTWTPPWFPAHGLHTYYEVGVFTQRVAFGYDLISDQLSEMDKSRIADIFWRNSIQPTLDDYFFNDRLPTAASNHMANSVGGAIAACVALDGDAPDWNDRLDTALAELTTAYGSLLKGLFPGDGSEAEPAGYEDFAMEGMSWGAAALQALGIRPPGTDRMLQAFWWLRYARFTPELFLDTGDFDGELSSLTGYAWGAENGNSPALRAFYGTAATRTLPGILKVEHTGRKLEVAPGLLDLVCCTRAAAPVPNPPTARIFPLRGSAVMRSGWSPGSTVISLRVGPWFNHEHHDQGSFQVAAWGEELISEAGYTDYYKDPRYADYFTQAPGHNTVALDADPFSQGDYDGRMWQALQRQARFQNHLFSTGIDYILADLAPAYHDSGRLQQYSREYIFIKPDILIVHDRLQSALPHSYTFFLHVPPGDHASIANSRALIHGASASAAMTAGGGNVRWTIQRAPVPDIAYVNLDQDSVKSRETLRLDSPPSPSADFLVAMRFQKGPGAARPLTGFHALSGEGFTGGPADSMAIIFRTGPGSLILRNTPLGKLVSDGDALAIRRRDGVTDAFAERTRTLNLAQSPLFSADPSPVSVVMRESPLAEKVWVDCSTETSLRIRTQQRAVTVTIDKVSVPVRVHHHTISVARVPKGEHLIEIRY
ncbi:MAG: heparinase II/III domain-containing protein [Terriglobia bacterium]